LPELAQERLDPLIITRGSSGAAVRAVQRRCQAGELVRLAPGIYARENDPQAQVRCVREHWIRILGELAPGAVVSYRSAYAAAPAEGVVILSHPTRFNRTIHLPGLRVALVEGPGALPGDAPLVGGALHLASMERMLLENLTRPRGADGRSRGEAAVQQRLQQILAGGGSDALRKVRGVARSLADALNMGRELARLEGMIEALLPPVPQQEGEEELGLADMAAEASAKADMAAEASAKAAALACAAAAQVAAKEADADCVATMAQLAQRLRWRRWEQRAVMAGRQERAHQAFVEAWFDCFATGSLPQMEQAAGAVLGGTVDAASSAPLRELLSAFKLALSSPLCDSVPPFGQGFTQGLRARHALLMRLVDPAAAGQLRSGRESTSLPAMIEPERIERTLAATSTLALDVPDGLARAVFYSILLWRVQPFERGNEPLAQLLMNAELASVGEARILVPARLRGRLQLARERLAREGDPGRYVRLLVALQHWSVSLDFSDLPRLLARLIAMRAFEARGQGLSEPP
jgi:hypothetical protein